MSDELNFHKVRDEIYDIFDKHKIKPSEAILIFESLKAEIILNAIDPKQFVKMMKRNIGRIEK